MSNLASLTRVGAVAFITIDAPPVNALSQDVRAAILESVRAANADSAIRALVIIGGGRTFPAGADIGEFDTGVQEPHFHKLYNEIEMLAKPVVAAMHGTALGGGVELALACHYRLIAATGTVGFPEITLGIVPGAGGSQRLPRLIGVKNTLDLFLTGKITTAQEAKASGVVDEIIDGDLREGALKFTEALLASSRGPRRTRDLPVRDGTEEVFAQAAEMARKTLKGRTTPALDIEAVRAAVTLPIDKGLEKEIEIAARAAEQIESKALRHLFFADRATARVPGMAPNTPVRNVEKAAVVGSGTMGGGISMAFANAGISVTLVDVSQEALERGLGNIKKNYDASVKRGRMTEADVARRMGLIRGSTRMADIAEVDLAIEAVFEKMELKKSLFQQMDAVLKPGAILATNTSTLDIDEIGAVTKRPKDVIGLHFFSPANVMKLLEIVRTDATTDEVVATAFTVAKRLKKVGVLARVGYGFIGNRMMDPYGREAERMVLEGATPAQIDGALESFGMAMGILAVYDMAGVDVGELTRQARKEPLPPDPALYRCTSLLFAKGWLGQKTGRGFYNYEGRDRRPNPQALQLFAEEGARLGIEQRNISEDEIVRRCLFAMVNEGAKVLEEGIAMKASDIDVVYTAGYGFPRHKGGPMFWADSLGLKNVLDGINEFKAKFGALHWEPSRLLVKLASEGRTFHEADK